MTTIKRAEVRRVLCAIFVMHSRIGDFIISAASELDQTESVPERIGHHRDVPPTVRAHFTLERAACSTCPFDRSANVFDREVQVHRRAMAGISSDVLSRGRGLGARWLFEKI